MGGMEEQRREGVLAGEVGDRAGSGGQHHGVLHDLLLLCREE